MPVYANPKTKIVPTIAKTKIMSESHETNLRFNIICLIVCERAKMNISTDNKTKHMPKITPKIFQMIPRFRVNDT